MMSNRFFILLSFLFSVLFIQAQSGADFVKAFHFTKKSSNIYDFKADSMGNSLLSIMDATGPMYVLKISADGQSVDTVYSDFGFPENLHFTPTDDGLVVSGKILECDVYPLAGVVRYDDLGNEIWSLTNEDLNLTFDDSIAVLPGGDDKTWVFRSEKKPVLINSNGSVAAYGTAVEPVFGQFVALPNNQYLTFGSQGLTRYNQSLSQRTIGLQGISITDAGMLDNGKTVAMNNDYIWVLNSDLEILSSIPLPVATNGNWIGVEVTGDQIYLLSQTDTSVDFFRYNDALVLLGTQEVSTQQGLLPSKFVIRNGQVYFAGTNSSGVVGVRSRPVAEPAFHFNNDAAVTAIFSPNAIGITPFIDGFGGYSAEWNDITVTVQNNGIDTLQSVEVNCVLTEYMYICPEQPTFRQKYSGLHLAPGDTIQIYIPQLNWGHPDVLFSPLNMCFWTSLPNDSLDAVTNNDTYCKAFPTVVSAAEAPLITGLNLYPNPATDHFTLDFQEHTAFPADIQVFDFMGREVRHLQSSQQQTRIQREQLPAGLYRVLVRTADGKMGASTVVFR